MLKSVGFTAIIVVFISISVMGQDNFELKETISLTNSPEDAVFKDINGDSLVDLVIGTNEGYVYSFLNDGTGQFSLYDSIYICDYLSFVTVADYDNDGFADFAASGDEQSDVYLYKNDQTGGFDYWKSLSASSFPPRGISADIDGNGLVDIVVGTWRGTDSYIYYNHANGDSFEATALTTSHVHDVISADFDGDSLLDLAFTDPGSNQIQIFIQFESGGFSSSPTNSYGSIGYVELASADFNNDECLDIVSTADENSISNSINLFIGDCDGTFDSTVSYPESSYTYAIVAKDFNLDGFTDLAFTLIHSDSISIYYSNGTGSFPIKDYYPVGDYPNSIATTDFDFDGDLDLAICNQQSNDVYLYINTFCHPYLPGDANMYAGQWPPAVIGADVTYLVNYFRAISPPCLLDGFYASADVNGDCIVLGADVTYLVNYFRGLTDGLHWCPDYQPCWTIDDDIPAEAPPDWPGCD